MYGYVPPEEDGVEGIRRAAARKLQHELGISLPPENFKYVSRIEYCAADPNPPSGVDFAGGEDQWRWGEHELDYILFCRTDLLPRSNPEEVQAVKYVTLSELQHMLGEEVKWSPWFNLVARSLLPTWWKDLKDILTRERLDNDTIYRF